MEKQNIKKMHLAALQLEITTACNLQCKHCFMGVTKAIDIKPEYIDALLDNVYGVGTLIILGGEIALKIDVLKMVLEKFKDADFSVNMVRFFTNGTEKSSELAQLFNDFLGLARSPKASKFLISADKYHLAASGIQESDLKDVMEFYRQYIPENQVEIPPLTMLGITGKARNLTLNELGNYQRAYYFDVRPSATCRIDVWESCNDGKCKLNNVQGCIDTTLLMGADGNVFAFKECAYDDPRREQKIICHIMEKSILDGISKWNRLCDANTEAELLSIPVNENEIEFRLLLIKAATDKFSLELADAYEQKDIVKITQLGEFFDAEITRWNEYLKQYSVAETIQTTLVRTAVNGLLDIYKYICFQIFFKSRKNINQEVIDMLRERQEEKQLYFDWFTAREEMDENNYIKLYRQINHYAERTIKTKEGEGNESES